MLKPTAFLIDSCRGDCPTHSLPFTLKHERSIVQDESASASFSHSCTTFLIFLLRPSYSDRSCHGITGMHLGRIHTACHYTMNPAPLFITNTWPLCEDSIILAGLGVVSIPSAPISLWTIKLNQMGKIFSLRNLQTTSRSWKWNKASEQQCSTAMENNISYFSKWVLIHTGHPGSR